MNSTGFTLGSTDQPGIFWDPREPPPSDSSHLQHSHRDVNQRPRKEWQQGANEPYSDFALFLDKDDNAPGIYGGNRPALYNGFLPPVSVSVDSSITHDTAKITVTQLFVNSTNSLIPRASYTFPLPPESTLIEFSCRVGKDKILVGKVKPKAEARETFENEFRQKRSAGLLQQNSHEIFTTTLGNLPPDTKLKASLSFIVLLKHSIGVDEGKGRMTFTLPTYIAPRYGTPPDDVNRLLGQIAPTTILSVSVDILAAVEILSLTSPSHPNADVKLGVATRQQWADLVANRVTLDARCASVRLPSETRYLDRDFTLQICTAAAVPEEPFACLEIHPEFPDQSALMLTIPPKALIGPPREYAGDEFIFIADRSGSMVDKMEALKMAMVFFLAGLPSRSSFNIWSFGTSFSSLWPHSREYDSSTRQEAESHVVNQFQSNLGGTQLLEVLEKVVISRGEFASTDIIILTDGEIWNPDPTLKFVKQTRLQSEGRIRFFSLGVGNAVSHELVEGIAKAGGGYAEVIQTASEGGWEGSLLAVLKAATERHVFPSSITLEWGDETEEVRLPDYSPEESLQSPHDITNLSPFMRNRVLTLLKHRHKYALPRAVRVHYVQPGVGEESLRVPVAKLRTPDSTVHKLAARALLGDLERGESCIHADLSVLAGSSTEEPNEVRLMGEALGCKWSLVSKWTSFVAVEQPVNTDALDEEPFADVDQEDLPSIRSEVRNPNLLRPKGERYAAFAIEEALGPLGSENKSSQSEDGEPDTISGQNEGKRRDSDNDPNPDGGPGHGGQSRPDPDRGDDGDAQGGHGGSNSRGWSDSESGVDLSEPTQGASRGDSTNIVVHQISLLGSSSSSRTGNDNRSIPVGQRPRRAKKKRQDASSLRHPESQAAILWQSSPANALSVSAEGTRSEVPISRVSHTWNSQQGVVVESLFSAQQQRSAQSDPWVQAHPLSERIQLPAPPFNIHHGPLHPGYVDIPPHQPLSSVSEDLFGPHQDRQSVRYKNMSCTSNQ